MNNLTKYIKDVTFASVLLDMKDQELERYFLETFQGASLRVPRSKRPVPGTVGAMASTSDRKLCKIVRFRFREKKSLEEIRDALQKYYDGIKWAHDLAVFSTDTVSGEVWPAGFSTCLVPYGFYEKDTAGQETLIFSYSLNPIIS